MAANCLPLKSAIEGARCSVAVGDAIERRLEIVQVVVDAVVEMELIGALRVLA